MKIPARIIKLVKRYQKILNIEDYSIEVILVGQRGLVIKQGRHTLVKQDYLAQVIQAEHNHFIVFLTPEALKNPSPIIKHELLHVLFWNLLEKTKSIIDLTELHSFKRGQLKAEVDTVEHDWIDKLIMGLK